jgi:hypothetical protein
MNAPLASVPHEVDGLKHPGKLLKAEGPYPLENCKLTRAQRISCLQVKKISIDARYKRNRGLGAYLSALQLTRRELDKILDSIGSRLNAKPGFLDLGCGHGIAAAQLAESPKINKAESLGVTLPWPQSYPDVKIPPFCYFMDVIELGPAKKFGLCISVRAAMDNHPYHKGPWVTGVLPVLQATALTAVGGEMHYTEMVEGRREGRAQCLAAMRLKEMGVLKPSDIGSGWEVLRHPSTEEMNALLQAR